MHSLLADLATPSHLQAATVCLVLCAGLGALGPQVIARLPEPVSPPRDAVADEADEAGADGGAERSTGDASRSFRHNLAPAAAKEPYVEIAARSHLAIWLAAGSGVVGASFGLVLGWTGALLYLVPLVPIGAVLLIVDWRTTLLPNSVIHPTYGLLLVLIPLSAWIDGDLDALYRAGWGWLVVGGWFWIFWFLFGAWGFGDVRLSRVLGPALGYLGWSHMLMGLGLMIFVGGIGGVVLALVKRSLRRRFPYGPFMLVGAATAVLVAPQLARSLGY